MSEGILGQLRRAVIGRGHGIRSRRSLVVSMIFLTTYLDAGLASACIETDGTTDPGYSEYKKLAQSQSQTPIPFCDPQWRAIVTAAPATTAPAVTPAHGDADPGAPSSYAEEAKRMEEDSLSGNGFGEAARTGLRGAEQLQRAGLSAPAEAVQGTSQTLHRVGQAARAGTFLGYGTASASIGTAVANLSAGEKGSSETLKKITDVASKASLAVGAGNIAVGAAGWGISRQYQSRGLARIQELEAQGNLTDDQKRNLAAARKELLAARKQSNEAALYMVANGGVNVAAGLATKAFIKEYEESEQDLATLEDSDSSATDPSIDNSGSASGADSVNGSAIALNNGTVTNRNAGNSGVFGNFNVDESPSGATDGVNSANIASIAATGASIDPSQFRKRRKSGKGGAGLGAGSTPIANDTAGATTLDGSSEESHSADEAMTSEIASGANPISNDVGFNGGGAFFGNTGSDSFEENPAAAMFGQIGKFAEDLQLKDSKKPGLAIDRRSLASGAAARYKTRQPPRDLKADENLFSAVKSKIFIMKYRGRI